MTRGNQFLWLPSASHRTARRMEANPLNSNPEKVVRKLTTILASDVVGYSKMMSADEEGTLLR